MKDFKQTACTFGEWTARSKASKKLYRCVEEAIADSKCHMIHSFSLQFVATLRFRFRNWTVSCPCKKRGGPFFDVRVVQRKPPARLLRYCHYQCRFFDGGSDGLVVTAGSAFVLQ